MTKIHFTVPIEPFGKGRPRFSTFGGHPVAYTPTKTRKNESIVKLYARRAMGDRYPFERGTALKVTIKAFFSIPKSYTKSRHEACISGLEKPTKRPDCDNVCKSVLDALNGSVFWDDNQVTSLSVEKAYTEGEGHIEVEVEKI